MPVGAGYLAPTNQPTGGPVDFAWPPSLQTTNQPKGPGPAAMCNHDDHHDESIESMESMESVESMESMESMDSMDSMESMDSKESMEFHVIHVVTCKKKNTS